MAVLPSPHRFTVEEYERMGEAGVFPPEERNELLGGEIVEMAPIGSPHARCVNWLDRFFQRLGDVVFVSVQNPVVLDDHSEPQPDLLLLRPRDDLYGSAHPRPADVLLLVEVADSTVAFDRRRKVPLYAAAAVAEVWLVDLPAEVVEVYRAPADGTYGDVQRRGRGETVSPTALPDAVVEVDELLG